MTQTKLIGQCDVLADDRAIVTFHAEESGDAPLWMELYDSRRDYPTAILGGLRENGYFDETEGNGLYRIPLGITHTVDIDDTSSADAGITHIKPVRFASPEGDLLAPLRDGGRLYLFINGHLWREIAVSGGGDTFRDINLARYQGEDQRPGDDGMETEPGAITLPYRLNGEPTLIQIAYSEIPWSWAYIETLGGLADDDPRYLPDLAAHKPYTTHRQNVDHELRMQRTTALSLNNFSDDYSAEQIKQTHLLVASTVENHYNQPEPGVPCALPGLTPMDIEDRLIIAALPDPLGIALDTVADIQLDLDELKQHLADIDNDEHAQSAVYAYQLFFNKDLHRTIHFPQRGTLYADLSQQAQDLRSAARRVSRENIEQLLRVHERRALRQRIREKRQALVHWLDGNQPDGTDASQGFTHFLTCHQALLDYAWLPLPQDNERQNGNWRQPDATPDYSALWGVIVGIISGSGSDPAIYDSGYDADPDPELAHLDNDPLNQWISQLTTPQHPLHAAIFPSAEQVPDDQPFEFDQTLAHAPARNSQFRPHAFAALNGAKPDWWYREAIAKELNSIIGTFIFAFQKQWQKAVQNSRTMELDLFVRFGKVSQEALKGAKLVLPGQPVPQGYTIIDGDLRIRQRLNRKQRRSTFRRGGSFPDLPKDRIAVMGNDEMLGSTKAHELYQNQGLPIDLGKAPWHKGFQSVDSKGLAIANGTVVVVPDDSDYVRHWNLRDQNASLNARLTTGVLRLGNVSLPPVLAVFEYFNLQSIREEGLKEGYSANIRAKGTISALALAYAITDTAIRIAGEPAAMRILTAPLPKAFGKPVLERATLLAKWGKDGAIRLGNELGLKTFAGLGAGLSAAGAALAAWETQIQWSQGNRASAGAHAIEAGAATGLALGQLGRAMTGEAVKRFALLRFSVMLGPWGWAFLGLTIAATLVAHSLRLSPLERWAAFGPFAADEDERHSQEFEGRDAQYLFRSLISLLQGPQVTLRHNNHYNTPRIEVTVMAPTAGANGIIHHEAHWYPDPDRGIFQPLKPIAWEPLLEDPDDPTTRIGLRTWYHAPEYGECQAQARVWDTQNDDWLPVADLDDPDQAAIQRLIEHTYDPLCDRPPELPSSGWAKSTRLRITG